MKYAPVHYHDYLGLKALLDSQKLRSEELGQKAHDEMLFIIVHQTYELWFKQILFELNSVLETFSQPSVAGIDIGRAVSRLERIVQIQKFILGQIDILETMTPLDFLEFRDMLFPASGFQSFQWRQIETKLGLPTQTRLQYNNSSFEKQLTADQQKEMLKIFDQPTLFDLIEKWLERTPFLQTDKFDFWKAYQTSVHQMFESDREVVQSNPRLNDDDKKRNIEQLTKTEEMFGSLFDDGKYEELRKQGHFRLSAKAIRAALLIQIFRDEPILQMPFRLLQSLISIDETLTQWRSRHALMAHRMLGRKIGTGGSSGHEYLRAAADQHKVFTDLFNLTTFFIPRSKIPSLPPELTKQMRFLGEK